MRAAALFFFAAMTYLMGSITLALASPVLQLATAGAPRTSVVANLFDPGIPTIITVVGSASFLLAGLVEVMRAMVRAAPNP